MCECFAQMYHQHTRKSKPEEGERLPGTGIAGSGEHLCEWATPVSPEEAAHTLTAEPAL